MTSSTGCESDGTTWITLGLLPCRAIAPHSGYVTSWNVRTLLDIDSPIEIARGFRDGSVVDERKVDQVLSELDRYGVVVAGLQESK